MSKNRLPNFLTTERGICITKRTLSDNYPEHAHDYFEIEYILSGKGRVYINDEPYELKPKTLCFFTPVDFEMIEAEENITLLNISFTEEWVDKDTVFELIFPAIIHDYTLPLTDRLIEEYNSKIKYNDIVIKNILNIVLTDIARQIKKHTTTLAKKLPIAIRRGLLYMRRHFNEEISLEAVANQAYLHPVYFSSLFKETMGVRFSKYLMDMRLEYAKRLLINSKSSVTEICYMSGFTSLSHFLRCFKTAFGTSPKKYRMHNTEKTSAFTKAEDYYF